MACQLDSNRTGFTMVSKRDFDILHGFKKIVGKCDYKARSGVEFTPAEVYFIEPVKKTQNPKTYYFKDSKFKNSIYKSKYNSEFELEIKYIMPVIKSPNIRAFTILESKNYCIFPYDNGNKESKKLKELIVDNELLANYLIENKSLVEKQSRRSLMISMGDEFYSLSKVGKYTFSPYKVVFRDNTIMHASVVTPVITPWNRTVLPICAKHCPYISMDNYGNEITEDEAYYICGILNTNIVRKYFELTFSGRSYSINFNIRIPKYNVQIEKFKRISNLSREASIVKNKEQLIDEIEKEYLELCDMIK